MKDISYVRRCALVGAAVCFLSVSFSFGDDLGQMGKAYESSVRPLLAKYCVDCHGPNAQEADIDFAKIDSMAGVRKEPKTWQKALVVLANGDMPPPDSPRPTDAERAQLTDWVRKYLSYEATASAGDPGPIVLRRLNNVELDNTIRDLTGVASLSPAKDFPVDGAAGEGFTNTGAALAMSPALMTKYLDAAKEVSQHMVLLPDGIRFSPHTTRSDWTNDILAEIRAFYGERTDASGGAKVRVQEVTVDTNAGGRLPVVRYLAALIAEREAIAKDGNRIDAIAKERNLSPKYLRVLWATLNSKEPSFLLDRVRRAWQSAKPGDEVAIANEVAAWQAVLFKFNTVGQVGKVGGSKSWQEAVSPLRTGQEFKFKLEPVPNSEEIVISLVASDAGDGKSGEAVESVAWIDPRIVATGRPSLALRDIRQVTQYLTALRASEVARTSDYLRAAVEAATAGEKFVLAEVAQREKLDPDLLQAWLLYLGVATSGPAKIEGHFTNKLSNGGSYAFIAGWGSTETPSLTANSSDQQVRVPGILKPHSVAIHPSPSMRAAIAWQSPVGEKVKVQGAVQHVHAECGNGVEWTVDLRRGSTRRLLAKGGTTGAVVMKFGPIENVSVLPGDAIVVSVGPRGGNHSCDTTAVDLEVIGEKDNKWDLAADVSPDIHAGNPHPDRQGNKSVWHFFAEADRPEGLAADLVPPGSLLDQWMNAKTAEEKANLAKSLQAMLLGKRPDGDSPDAQLHGKVNSFAGPLFGSLWVKAAKSANPAGDKTWGIDPARFGKMPSGEATDPSRLVLSVNAVETFRLPADLVAGAEFVAVAIPGRANESIQAHAAPGAVEKMVGTIPMSPILVADGSDSQKKLNAGFDAFRNVFPATVCYPKIVPVDEAVTLTLFYREDDELKRLLLNDAETATIDRLWDELHYVSHDYITLVDAFHQLMEYATQDSDPRPFEPLRQPIYKRAEDFRQRLVATEPQHLDAVIDLANRAFRRPLSDREVKGLRGLYQQLRTQELPHDEAIRLTLARILVAPSFLYRLETPVAGKKPGPVSPRELAVRLSYFLWSSMPDAELERAASAGELATDDGLLKQLKRMLADPKARRLGSEFACQWLHLHDFANHNEKSETHFPEFASLRGAMHEETIEFCTHLFQENRSVLDLLNADYVYVNGTLAKLYGIDAPAADGFVRVDQSRRFGRGGVLTLAASLSKQSGASRTSPILRGNWVSEVLLGERLPRPPKNVPQLPETAPQDLTERQLTEKHSSDPACAKCHVRVDPIGYSLENFDAIGRRREKDTSGLAIDSKATLRDGTALDGADGLRKYLAETRRDDFLRQFNKKLLGYALGRSVQLSDEPLLNEMLTDLKSHDYKVQRVFEKIVLSPQFRTIRGREQTAAE